MTAPAPDAHQATVDLLGELYPGVLALLLVKCCGPRPHQHKDRNGSYEDCESIGKRPVETAWNRAAVERYESGTGAQRTLRLRELARHLAAGGNIGFCPPPGTVVLDADSLEDAKALRQRILDDTPRQRTARGIHAGPFLLPPGTEIRAKVGQQITAELEGGLVVDLRVGGKSQIVSAPSIHKTGAVYERDVPLPERIEDLPDLPAAIAEALRRAGVLTDANRKRHATSTGAGETTPNVSAEDWRAAGERIARVWPAAGEGGARHAAQLALVGALVREGWPLSLAVQFVVDVLSQSETDDTPESEIERFAHEAAERLEADERVAGWGILRKLLGDVAVAEARQHLGLEREEPPPHSDEDARHHEAPSADRGGENLTDLGNARRLVSRHGRDLLFCYLWMKWLAWDGRRWAVDETGVVHRCAKKTVRGIYGEAQRTSDEDRRKALAAHAHRSESDSRIRAMIALATSEPRIPIRPDELDTDPWALTVTNGTLDLRTGTLRAHRREDRATKLAPVVFDPDAESALWTQFLERVLPDPDVRLFVQRAVGYALTGLTVEQVFFILYGTGANGKSTFIETLLALLGDFALKTPADTILDRRETAIPNDVARLRGARLVTAVEIEEGRRLAEVRLKELTGGDTISARFMRGEWFDFRPVCKLWIGTNCKPVVRGTDLAIWRRIRLIPFTETIPENERDPHLAEKLRAELPGILRWALDGCLAWQQRRLDAPQAVQLATGTYRQEQDILGNFIDECCTVGVGRWVFAGDLHREYRQWCEQNGERWLSQKALAPRLEQRGFTSDRKGHGGRRVWRGVALEHGDGDG